MNPLLPELFNQTLSNRIEKCGVIAVLIIDDENDAVPLAKALLDGGVTAMELTLRTPAALPALEKITASVPQMLAGIGTIFKPEQVREVMKRGAAFGVSPGVNPRVLDAAREAGLSFAPGIATPSDIETSLEYGCKLLKFFPSEPSGGLPYLKAMSAPYAHLNLHFIPLGGLNAKNISSYLAEPIITALGGSWLAPRDLITSGSWSKITALAAETVQIIQSIRTK